VPCLCLVQYELNGITRKTGTDETPYGIGKDAPGVSAIPAEQTRRILYLTLRTSPDPFIKPEESAILDGAGAVKISLPAEVRARETSPGNLLMTHRVGHDEMLEDGETLQLLKALLVTEFYEN